MIDFAWFCFVMRFIEDAARTSSFPPLHTSGEQLALMERVVHLVQETHNLRAYYWWRLENQANRERAA